jgi:hypothetical protein
MYCMTVLNHHHVQLATNSKIRAITSEVRGGGVCLCASTGGALAVSVLCVVFGSLCTAG